MAADVASSPALGFKTVQEEIAYYKSQYETLESELQDFQQSSKELEAELEKDIEASEKRERQLKEKVESLKYEVEEWKNKHKQSKADANQAQNQLQKEITGLRDQNRTMQLKLRDIEVANDDYERQARNTTSSLEDMEQKYSQAIERGVMLEEEVKGGEQEREQLRIEAQRLREELSDLKVESDILNEKLRAAESQAARRLKRVSQLSDGREHGVISPTSEASFTSVSMQSTSTPPIAKSDVGSDAATPPSPPLSDLSLHHKAHAEADLRSSVGPGYAGKDPNTTPRPSNIGLPRPHRRGPSISTTSSGLPQFSRSQIGRPRPSGAAHDHYVPRSESLYQIRGLIGKMQNLEKRVQSARSKLPAPTNTPPRASPRGTGYVTPAGHTPLASQIPSNITLRSSRKRTSLTSSAATPSQDGRGSQLSHHMSRASTSRHEDRTHSRAQGRMDSRSESRQESRPSSRLSNVGGFARPASRASGIPEPTRPPSAADKYRPRSSMAGSYEQSHMGRRQSQSSDPHGYDYVDNSATPTLRRTIGPGSAIPAPPGIGRRQSTSTLAGGPTPARTKMEPPKPAEGDLGETW